MLKLFVVGEFDTDSTFIQIDGCVNVNYEIRTNRLQNKYYFRSDVKLRIDASVTEDATNVTLNETTVTSRFEFRDVKLKVEAPKYFKPGFPFYAKV